MSISMCHTHILLVNTLALFRPTQRRLCIHTQVYEHRYNKAIGEGTLHKLLPNKDQPQNGMAISNPER
jgi:hypothetical protein